MGIHSSAVLQAVILPRFFKHTVVKFSSIFVRVLVLSILVFLLVTPCSLTGG
jgi:hypothetical protein